MNPESGGSRAGGVGYEGKCERKRGRRKVAVRTNGTFVTSPMVHHRPPSLGRDGVGRGKGYGPWEFRVSDPEYNPREPERSGASEEDPTALDPLPSLPAPSLLQCDLRRPPCYPLSHFPSFSST